MSERLEPIVRSSQMETDNQVKYETCDCYSCGIAILVDVNRTSPRNYCQACAWAKLGETNVTHSK